MDSGQNSGGNLGIHELASTAEDTETTSQKRLRSGCSQANYHFGTNDFELSIEPRPTGIDFRCARFFMNATLAPRRAFPTEMLDGIGYVDVIAINTCLGQRLVEQAAGGSHEWLTLDVLAVAWLFSHEYNAGVAAPLAKHGLRRLCPKIAS